MDGLQTDYYRYLVMSIGGLIGLSPSAQPTGPESNRETTETASGETVGAAMEDAS